MDTPTQSVVRRSHRGTSLSVELAQNSAYTSKRFWISPASDLRHFTQFRGALFPFHSSRTRVPCSHREQSLSSSFVRKRYLSNNVACTSIRAISLSHEELRISCRITLVRRRGLRTTAQNPP